MAAKSGKTQTLRFKRMVNAPPAEVYRAFTKSTALREWLCDLASADARKGGRLYLWWNDGYYACGEYTAVTPGKRVAFTWRGRGEPGATRVGVSIAPKDGGALVTVAHGGVPGGKAWAKTVKMITRGWEVGLENLGSVLESGPDLRVTLRPMLGITVGEFTPQLAAKLGVPVTEGVRLDSVIEGMGAKAAGLQRDDVIVGIGRKKVKGWASLTTALQAHRAGDRVPVTLYRGSERLALTMELSRRPLPDTPPTAQALADAVRNMYAGLDAELARCFEGVSESEASHRPAPGEWSAKDVVAHLMAGERDGHAWIAELIAGEERWYDDFGGNIDTRHAGVLAAFPTVPAMLEELRRNEAETVAMLAALPAEFVARKSTYWRLCFNFLQPPFHHQEHFNQIRAAIAAARKM